MQLDCLQYIHQKLSEQIAAEFDLLGQRMTWLLLSNSFLFTATAISASTLTQADSGRLNGLAWGVAFAVPVLGITTSCLIIGPMNAARDVIRQWKQKRKEVETQLLIEIEFDHPLTVDAQYPGHRAGNRPYQLQPYLFAAAWGIILIATLLYWKQA